MSMARVPPSSADFTPAWLKFNNNNKGGASQNKNARNNHLQSHSRSPLRLSPTTLSDFESQALSNRRLGRHHSVDSDKSWPIHVGIDGSVEEKVQSTSSSKVSHKWSFTSVNNGNSFQKLDHDLSPSKSNALDMDFPSLENNGTQMLQQRFFAAQSNNMWSKPLNMKQSCNDSTSGSVTKGTTMKPLQSANSIYKNLVPKSNSGFVKQPYRRTVSVPAGSHNDTKPGSSTNAISKKKITLPTPSMAPKAREPVKVSPIASEETHVTPAMKRHRKGKNVFLKELRKENDAVMKTELNSKPINNEYDVAQVHFSPDDDFFRSDSSDSIDLAMTDPNIERNVESHKMDNDCEYETSNLKQEESDWWNDNSKITDQVEHNLSKNHEGNDPPLSSSLEAEHRLLREMGWTQGDEGAEGDGAGSDESPLTDAEIREFFLNNKRRGLLGASSPSHREVAFRDALSAWSLAGPILRRPNHQIKITQEDARKGAPSECSSSDDSQLSDLDSDSD